MVRFMGSLFAGGGPRLQRDVGYRGSMKKDWGGACPDGKADLEVGLYWVGIP